MEAGLAKQIHVKNYCLVGSEFGLGEVEDLEVDGGGHCVSARIC